jgi:hypothetical protein
MIMQRMAAELQPAVGGVAVAFSMFVGVFFGFYPAWREQTDPIVALRRNEQQQRIARIARRRGIGMGVVPAV